MESPIPLAFFFLRSTHWVFNNTVKHYKSTFQSTFLLLFFFSLHSCVFKQNCSPTTAKQLVSVSWYWHVLRVWVKYSSLVWILILHTYKWVLSKSVICRYVLIQKNNKKYDVTYDFKLVLILCSMYRDNTNTYVYIYMWYRVIHSYISLMYISIHIFTSIYKHIDVYASDAQIHIFLSLYWSILIDNQSKNINW